MEKADRALCERAMAGKEGQHSDWLTAAHGNRQKFTRILGGRERNHDIFLGIVRERGLESMERKRETHRALEIPIGQHMSVNCLSVHHRL